MTANPSLAGQDYYMVSSVLEQLNFKKYPFQPCDVFLKNHRFHLICLNMFFYNINNSGLGMQTEHALIYK